MSKDINKKETPPSANSKLGILYHDKKKFLCSLNETNVRNQPKMYYLFLIIISCRGKLNITTIETITCNNSNNNRDSIIQEYAQCN